MIILWKFAVLVEPLFIYLDNTKWEQQQIDVGLFDSFFTAAKRTNSFEQIGNRTHWYDLANFSCEIKEFYLIDKIIEYLDYSTPYSSKHTTAKYNFNREKGVRIKIFNLLGSIFAKLVSNCFLSFLYIEVR